MAPRVSAWLLALAIPCFLGAGEGSCSSDACAGDQEGDASALLASRASFQSAQGRPPFSLMTPDSSKLVWDTVNEGHTSMNPNVVITSLHGWLKVPLDYDNENAPHVCLRVSAHTASKRPPRGVLFSHCGGPGEGRSCSATFLVKPATAGLVDHFAMVSINQRGIQGQDGEWEPDVIWRKDGSIDNLDIQEKECPFKESNGDPVLPFPMAICDDIMERLFPPEEGAENGSANSATEGAVTADGLSEPEGEPSAADEAAQMNARKKQMEPVRKRLVELINQFMSPDAKVPSEDDMETVIRAFAFTSGPRASDGKHGVFVRNETFVRWLYRLTALEHSLCVNNPKYQLNGSTGESFNVWNYMGTRMLARDMDSLRWALGQKKLSVIGASYGTTVAAAYATLFKENVDLLVLDGVCPPEMELFSFLEADSMGLFSVWQGIARDCAMSESQQLPEEERCSLAPVPSTKLIDMIENASDPARASAAFTLMTEAIGNITKAPWVIDCLAKLQSGENTSCAQDASAPVDLTDPSRGLLNAAMYDKQNRFATWNGAIFGTDVSGRLSEESFISWWQENLKRFPLGTGRTVMYAAAMGSWPLNAQPLPPLGNAVTPALVIGNLHDPATDYTGAQRMRAVFPKGRMMTWQGYGHIMFVQDGAEPYTNTTQAKNVEALDKCKGIMVRYLTAGELPDDGHTCLIGGPLSLGSRAVQQFCEKEPDKCQ